jgi:glucose/arabinose dehydrogenase
MRENNTYCRTRIFLVYGTIKNWLTVDCCSLLPGISFITIRTAFLSISLFLSVYSTSIAATLPADFSETQVALGLSSPTAMAFAPDGRLFICEESGTVRVIKNGALLATPFATLNADSSDERGLLGIAVDPNFATNQFLYVYYTAPLPTVHNRVSRLTANGDVAVGGSEVVILELNTLTTNSNHAGGGLHFGADGKLYIATGDDNVAANSQTLANLFGKLLRVNSDGSIPNDNPFFGTATGDNRAIWALGLRNPFTFGFQPGTGRLFINDVGDLMAEEINDAVAGGNYGWPSCEGPCSPANVSFRDPIFAYGHGSSGTTGCAIVGAAFYNPPVSQFPSGYTGKYFFADFCSGWIRRFDPITNTVSDFASGVLSPADLAVSPDGSLYYLARSGGTVYRIQYNQQPGGVFQFGASSYTVSEAQTSSLITVTRTGDTSTAAAVNYSTSDGTASDRSDYTTAIGTLNFVAGETSHTFKILISNDVYVEGDETVNLALTKVTTGATVSTSLLTIQDDDTTPPTTNPADEAPFFVRQHYFDFLGREPDPDGFTYWTGQISQCGNNMTCLLTKRIDVSDAFVFEPEYQQTGAYVFRLYRAAYGNSQPFPNPNPDPGHPGEENKVPNYSIFLSDRERVIGGANLAQKLSELATTFAQRPEFLSRYPGTLDGPGFVDALLMTVRNDLGVDLTAERSALITLFNSGGRGAVLYRLADDNQDNPVHNGALIDAEYNRVFVATEYFGYLRRNPDISGFLFWLGQVNSAPLRDISKQHAMVCAFITSDEYQRRFSSILTHSNNDCPH